MVSLPTPAKWAVRLVAVAYVFLLVGWPLVMLVQKTVDSGWASIQATFSDPDVMHAFIVTIEISLWAVAINTVFGVGMALLLVRYEFPGKRTLSALIDLPMAVSPIVIGLALLLVYNGVDGWFGPTLEANGLQVIFNSPGMIMATCFVSLPLVIREVVPVLEEIGDDQEQAARSLGANAVQTLRRITLPAIKWAVVYGVVLTLARSLGEFGALKIVSGNLTGRTQTAPLVVEQKYQNFAQSEAYTVSLVLVLISVLCIVVVSLLRPKETSNLKIEIKNVNKNFGDFVALDDINVSLPTGQLTALLGPSGGGKSTLLRIIAGLEKADTGTVEIEGINATKMAPQKRNVGFVFQHYAVFKHMTVAKNVAFGLEIRKKDKAEVRDRVEELLKLVHLSQFADRLPSQLSGGQRQRMALARALAVQPKVLLLDEPFGALDAKVRKELREWLRRLHDEVPVTTVFVTHDQEEAMEVADEIVVINDGRIEQVGAPDDLYDAPANDFVMGFLGEVTALGNLRMRPHDIEIGHSPALAGSIAADLLRMTRVGFEVRLVAGTEDGQEVSVVTTRSHARSLGLEEGQRVWLTPSTGATTVPAMKSVLVS